MIDMDDYKYVTNMNGYLIYRKIVGGKGKWKAKHQDGGESFDITYEQALGYQPIDSEQKLQMELGRLLGLRRCFNDTERME